MRLYEAATFTPSTSGCVQVTLQSNSGIFPIAYDASGFVPGNPSLNYLADYGNSSTSNSPVTFSSSVIAGVPFTVVVSELNPAGHVGQNYMLEVGGVALGSGFELPLFEDGFESGDTSAWWGELP